MDAHFAVSFQAQTSNAHARAEWPRQITSGRRGAAWRLRRTATPLASISGYELHGFDAEVANRFEISPIVRGSNPIPLCGQIYRPPVEHPRQFPHAALYLPEIPTEKVFREIGLSQGIVL
jgi:hypothetical protein